MSHKYILSLSRRQIIISVASILLFTSGTAFGINVLNTPSSGYLLCVDTKTKIVTYPATQSCPSSSSDLVLGKQDFSGTQVPTSATSSQSVPSSSTKFGGLAVLDKNNNLVGYPLGLGQGDDNTSVKGLVTEFNETTLWLPTIKNFMSFYLDGKPTQQKFYFTSNDCTGTPYIGVAGPSDSVGYRDGSFSPSGSINWYLPGFEISKGTYTFLSLGGGGNCINTNTIWNASSSMPLESWIPATSPLQSLNIVGPLHFASN